MEQQSTVARLDQPSTYFKPGRDVSLPTGSRERGIYTNQKGTPGPQKAKAGFGEG